MENRSPVFRLTALVTLGFFVAAQVAIAQQTQVAMNSFQTALIPIEGGGAGFQAQNPNTNALGAFQMTPVALQDIGWQDSSGNWTPAAAAAGVTSTSSFLSNPQAQVAADNAYNQNNIGYLGSTYSQRLGTTDVGSGAPLTQGNMAYCAEALGASGCQQYLSTGQVPSQDLAENPQWANGGFQQNMAQMGNTSLGDTSNVNVSTISTTNADGTTTSTTTVNGVFCDPAILQAATQAGQNMANNWTTLAESPGTGYSMLGGQSVLQAAGLLSPGSTGYVAQNPAFANSLSPGQSLPFGGANFAMASCLNSLMGSGLNLIFSPMGLQEILNAILAAACGMAMQLFETVTEPINQTVYQNFSLGGILPPQLNMGSFGSGGGMFLSPGAASGTGSLINVNAGSYGNYNLNPNTGWYQQGGTPATTSPYTSLFGNNPFSNGSFGNNSGGMLSGFGVNSSYTNTLIP